MAEKRKGQTKQSHSGIASQAKKITGRTKETHSGVASQAKAMKGRTKENNEGMKQSANKRRGRTKETCPGVASMANKLRGRTIIKKPKLPEEIINEIYKKHLLGIKQVDIFRWVIELGYSISQRTIGNMIHKTKQSLKSDNQ